MSVQEITVDGRLYNMTMLNIEAIQDMHIRLYVSNHGSNETQADTIRYLDLVIDDAVVAYFDSRYLGGRCASATRVDEIGHPYARGFDRV